METQTFRIFKFVIIPLLIATALVFYFEFEMRREAAMEIDFYDVGQGDGLMITTYEGAQVVVDGGPGSKILEGVGSDLPFFDRTIEMVVLTHPHADHLQGLIPIMRRYTVKKVLVPNIEYHSSEYDEFLAEVARQHSEMIYAVQGQRIWLDRSTVFDVLYPASAEKIQTKKNDDLNDYSIVGQVIFGKTKILLTGDSGEEIERQLLPRFNLDSDLLKVGHHGSKYSTSQDFLDEVTPEYSIISSGENKYGHPDAGVIERLQKKDSQILRTDQRGDIQFRSDGTRIYAVE
jgi:beta-lactamase superfamily II metal-dependent hydrolase